MASLVPNTKGLGGGRRVFGSTSDPNWGFRQSGHGPFRHTSQSPSKSRKHGKRKGRR